jgi:hypothetical protein
MLPQTIFRGGQITLNRQTKTPPVLAASPLLSEFEAFLDKIHKRQKDGIQDCNKEATPNTHVSDDEDDDIPFSYILLEEQAR